MSIVATLSVTLASRLCLRVSTYIFKWAFAWAVLNAMLFALNSFPAYSLARDALLETAFRLYNSTGAHGVQVGGCAPKTPSWGRSAPKPPVFPGIFARVTESY